MTTSKKTYNEYSKDELIALIKTLKKRKKYGLVWEDKAEEVAETCKTFLPILEKENEKNISTNQKEIDHIFIQGDNYHALAVLNYTHKKKVDVIFIDPPYNTGSQSWIYNNSYVDKEDRFRHSKWLSFMSKRLRLARNLLKDSGFFAITIDHNELFTLGLLMDEIFGEGNRIGIVTVLHNPKGRNQAKFFSENSEFLMLYAKDISKAQFNSVAISEDAQGTFTETDSEGKFRYEPYMRARTAWSRANRPKNWYPIYVSKDLKKITHKKQKGYYEIFPITNNGKEMAWKNIQETFIDLNKNTDFFEAKKEGNKIVIYHKYREQQVLKNVWTDKKYQSEFNGTNLLKKIFGDKRFDYPKSLYLVMDVLKITSKEDSIILDFFAGSGTTGHAVLELNNEDSGNRQFILCTNNENNNGNGGIAETVCYPRIKKVIEGYKNPSGEAIAALGGNLRYYMSQLIDNIKTDNDKRVLTSKCGEMLCLAENTFNEVISKKGAFSIHDNQNQMTGIIYDEDAISDFKKEAKKYKKSLVVYVFSYDHTYNEEDFEDLENLRTVKPIPEVILNVYRKIYKELYKPHNL